MALGPGQPQSLFYNTVTTSGTMNMGLFTGVNSLVRIGDRNYNFDTARMQYTSVDDPKVVLTQEMVLHIQQGVAILDWENRRLKYLDRPAYVQLDMAPHKQQFSQEYPGSPQWDQPIGAGYKKQPKSQSRENRQWLDQQVNAVRQYAFAA